MQHRHAPHKPAIFLPAVSPCGRVLRVAILVMLLPLNGCEETDRQPAAISPSVKWADRVSQSRGTTVQLAMWDGDASINQWMRESVRTSLREHYGIELKFSGLRGHQLVSRLMSDLEANRVIGDLDLVWINGETFYQLRKINALAGPFTELLPNARLIDWQDPFISQDFQQPVDGFECPWGTVQMTIIYNESTVAIPPRTLKELEDWIRQHPGRFTFDCSFTGMTFLKSLLLQFSEAPEAFATTLNESEWDRCSNALWSWIRKLRPHLWREGRVFPDDVAQLHHLLNSGEVDFSMSNNDGEVDNKIRQGILPPAARAYVPDWGTIRNTHYLGIPVNAPNRNAAMLVINHLISPAAQLEKMNPSIWGDGTVLDLDLLSAEWQQKFRGIPGRERAPSRTELRKHALMEPNAEVMIRIHEGFRREILESPQ